jgi:hypothetical protein
MHSLHSGDDEFSLLVAIVNKFVSVSASDHVFFLSYILFSAMTPGAGKNAQLIKNLSR